MRIQVPLEWSWGRGERWKIVNAELVDICPRIAHLATFVVHESPEPYYGRWAVSNVETGLNISRGPTKSEAIRRAIQKTNNVSIQRVVARLKKANNALGKTVAAA